MHAFRFSKNALMLQIVVHLKKLDYSLKAHPPAYTVRFSYFISVCQVKVVRVYVCWPFLLLLLLLLQIRDRTDPRQTRTATAGSD